jgi:uncharacterized protein (TIGR00251 family)
MAGLPPLRIAVRVQPRSSRDRVVGVHGASIKVQVTAPPVEGAANAAVVEVLAGWLHVPRRSVSVAHGQTGRDKTIEIDVDGEAERRRIEKLIRDLVDSPGGCA